MTAGSESEVDIVTSDDIKIYYTGKFQDFTAWYIINETILSFTKRQNFRHVQIESNCRR